MTDEEVNGEAEMTDQAEEPTETEEAPAEERDEAASDKPKEDE